MRKIEIDLIIPDPEQPRKTFEDDHIEGLANSIGKYGFIAPIVVRPHKDGKYMIVVGESRYRAAKKRGDKEIECIEVEVSDTTAREMQFVENYHRRDIPPLELAYALKNFRETQNLSQRELSNIIGISDKRIVELESLCCAAQQIQDYVRDGSLDASTAYEITRIPDEKKQVEFADIAVDAGMPRSQVRPMVKMAIEEPEVPAEDIERCVRLGIPEPPKRKQRKTTLDLSEIMKALTSQFAKLALLTSNGKVGKETLTEYAIELYGWRDSIERLIKIMEVEGD